MANTYQAALDAVLADDSLRDRLLKAETSEAKCNVLRSAKIEPPTKEDLEAAKAKDPSIVNGPIGVVWCGVDAGHSHATD
jgi:hypothetical protein